MNRFVCIHGHFYQPPRENPWLEEVELQDSAYPYHDWNDRITAECYEPNTASRILDSDNKIINIINNVSHISFNFGPTLLSWMERHKPDVYYAILEADQESRERFSGHGSAIAQVYSHIILPLAPARDKHTQILWGMRDFEQRFGRTPEGMWLAETAVDSETLDVLAQHGISFTILAPGQAARIRKVDNGEWEEVAGGKIDPRRPYLWRSTSGRTIAIFFYDGAVAQEVAFGGLLKSGEQFVARLLGLFSEDGEPQLAHIATDGESYGHHHRFGDMALGYALHHIESTDGIQLANYGWYLEMFPPIYEVEIIENTSWSCSHGVERWRSDCGCNTGGRQGWTQQWRAPLREAMDWLAERLATTYEKELGVFVSDVWKARDDYIEIVVDRSPEQARKFLSRLVARDLTPCEVVKVFKLLEMQRHAMLMFTSCGWFFDELSGIETVQVMQYARRAMQLAFEVSGEDLEPGYVEFLEEAPSNVKRVANGVGVWESYVKPATVDLLRVAGHYAVSSVFEEYQATECVFSYTVHKGVYELYEAGIQRLAVGKSTMHSDITGEEAIVSFSVLHLGGHNLMGGVREFTDDEAFSTMRQDIVDAFERSNVAEVIRLMDNHFGTHNYSLWHLFKDEQRKIMGQILDTTLHDIEGAFRQIYEHHYPVMRVMRDVGIPLPEALATTTEFIISTDIRQLLEDADTDLDRLERLVDEAQSWSFAMDRETLGFVATGKINELMGRVSEAPISVGGMDDLYRLFNIIVPLGLDLNLWKAQNRYFDMSREHLDGMRTRAEQGDEAAREWIERLNGLAEHLHVRTT